MSLNNTTVHLKRASKSQRQLEAGWYYMEPHNEALKIGPFISGKAASDDAVAHGCNVVAFRAPPVAPVVVLDASDTGIPGMQAPPPNDMMAQMQQSMLAMQQQIQQLTGITPQVPAAIPPVPMPAPVTPQAAAPETGEEKWDMFNHNWDLGLSPSGFESCSNCACTKEDEASAGPCAEGPAILEMRREAAEAAATPAEDDVPPVVDEDVPVEEWDEEAEYAEGE